MQGQATSPDRVIGGGAAVYASGCVLLASLFYARPTSRESSEDRTAPPGARKARRWGGDAPPAVQGTELDSRRPERSSRATAGQRKSPAPSATPGRTVALAAA